MGKAEQHIKDKGSIIVDIIAPYEPDAQLEARKLRLFSIILKKT